jgi:hypothetical protein
MTRTKSQKLIVHVRRAASPCTFHVAANASRGMQEKNATCSSPLNKPVVPGQCSVVRFGSALEEAFRGVRVDVIGRRDRGKVGGGTVQMHASRRPIRWRGSASSL